MFQLHNLQKAHPIWQELPQEDHFTTTPWLFRLLSAKPKSIFSYNSSEITKLNPFSFPRLKRLRVRKSEKSHERVVAFRKKNNDTWISILSHLHRYSHLYKKQQIAAIKKNIYPMFSPTTTRSIQRDISKFGNISQNWCEHFGFHPANITTSFLLDIIFEATHGYSAKHTVWRVLSNH